jgi:predicted nuclease of predicted toxin-antitoxin system
MKIKLFLDEDVHSGLAIALRKRGYDVYHTQELDVKGRSDLEQLAFAAQDQRCLVTFNVRDFVILHNHYVQTQQDHWGIIVSKQIPLRETLHRILRVLQKFSMETLKNRIKFL